MAQSRPHQVIVETLHSRGAGEGLAAVTFTVTLKLLRKMIVHSRCIVRLSVSLMSSRIHCLTLNSPGAGFCQCIWNRDVPWHSWTDEVVESHLHQDLHDNATLSCRVRSIRVKCVKTHLQSRLSKVCLPESLRLLQITWFSGSNFWPSF